MPRKTQSVKRLQSITGHNFTHSTTVQTKQIIIQTNVASKVGLVQYLRRDLVDSGVSVRVAVGVKKDAVLLKSLRQRQLPKQQPVAQRIRIRAFDRIEGIVKLTTPLVVKDASQDAFSAVSQAVVSHIKHSRSEGAVISFNTEDVVKVTYQPPRVVTLGHSRKPKLTYKQTDRDDTIGIPMNSEHNDPWSEIRLPKTNNLKLAEQLVQQGYVRSIDDIYVALTPEQKSSLEAKRREWEKERKYENNDYEWSD